MGNQHMGVSRRGLLGSAIAVAAAAATGGKATAATPAPQRASQGASQRGEVPALWHEFTRTPFTHPQIPYVGRAGYRAGTARFPAAP